MSTGFIRHNDSLLYAGFLMRDGSFITDGGLLLIGS
jgi:hypothetical protein